MATRQNALLLDGSVQPANGFGTPVQWYGGPIDISIVGAVYSTASFEIWMNPKMPVDGLAASIDPLSWVKLGGPYTADQRLAFDNLNPCLLAVKTINTGVTTRVRAAFV